MSANQTYFIGDCKLESHTMLLSLADKQIKLSAKVYELLILFIESENHIVSTELAIEQVWNNNEGVGKRGFRNATWMLRKSFKDLGIEQDIFQTLSKVGYQLMLPVSQVDDEPIAAPAAPKSTNKGLYALNGLALIALVVVLVLWPSEQKEQTVAVNNYTSYDSITNFEGTEEHPAVSNTGQYLAFQWRREGSGGELYVKDLTNDDSPLNLITHQQVNEASPAWASDDQLLAYVRTPGDNQCEIRLRKFLTNADTALVDDCYYFPYRRVLTWSNGNNDFVSYSKNHGTKVAIHSLELKTKKSTQITNPQTNEVDYAPHWSADNKQMVFIRDKGAVRLSDLILIDENQQEQVILSNKISIIDVDWDLTENTLYVSTSEDGRLTNLSIDLETGEQKAISNLGLGSNLSFNQASKKLLFSSHISKEYVALIDLKSQKTIKRISSSSRDMYARYVAHKKDILFLSNRSGYWSLWKKSNAGSVNVTKSMGNSLVPAVSHNGEQFAVIVKKDSTPALYLGDTNTYKLNPVDTKGLKVDNLSWSRDDSAIYFVSNKNDNVGIYKLTLSTGDIEQITNSGEQYAIEGDNGQLFVSRINRDGLWLYEPTTKEFTLFTDELAQYDHSSYFYQDNGVYYVNRTWDSDQIKKRHLDGREEILMTFPADSIRKHFGISAAKDDTIVATLKITNESDIVSVALQ
ncbi:hypothetical protein E2K93_01850 [Thalassotalea sp. HSM 43]|uniref:winged helix-turn-helix domain-containing protein n=1 Tax=Thalassotalea sp. HSM 43 TaxID=2552945 RepID=UPI001080309C|nr:winged helix-turn-helix domain-containing protein [Thalassotalea sp. HSM 43]QBY03187.1 hypothetical protein E2K93_01850 [Thalassotalea sp. HSM 43]